ncbi:MAG: UDP-glucose 4-epimerase GalE, partial [Candidatus Sumerlaeota bacterium]|nr:UDP-glucose 4-epimerase GalE [Candidatus Sumerlaeota bacterium]
MASEDSGILIVGGAGYVGSNFGLYLLDRGIPYVTLDSLELGHRELVRGELLEANLRDPASLRRVFEGRAFSTVFHFAAYIVVGESNTKPVDYFENNVVGTYNLLKVALDHGMKKFIFSSTAATYGDPRTPQLEETHPQNPINHYGWTKLVVEQMLERFRLQYGIGAACLRYFNAAGADEQGRSGEMHSPETHLIPLAIRAALGTGPALSVYGDDYPTPDGTCIRDYIHVADLAHAHWLAARKLQAGERLALNLGTEQGASVREVLQGVEEVAGRPVPHTIAPRRPGDPPRLVACARLARETLGWKPARDLDTILKTA